MRKIFLIYLFFSLIFTQDKKDQLKKDNNEKMFNNSEDTKEYLKMYNKSFELLLKNYADSINESEVIKSGIKGMMKPLDPYTKLLEGDSKDSYDLLRRGKYGGVGMQIGIRRDTLTVLAPMEDSPSYSEGINAGDQILKIDTTFTVGLSIKEAVSLIKGDVGTPVQLSILRPSTKEKIEFELFRDNITVKHVPYWGIDENGIGYIRVTKFSKNSAKDFKTGLEYFKNEDKLEGIIIDLRGNSGGLLSNAVKMLDYVTERGELLLTSKGKNTRSNKTWKSRIKPIIKDNIPIVVLIDKSSASASEIVSGALQDLDRAVIIGQKSYGKGLVQHMYDLNDTITLKITTAKYYLPSGRLIQSEDYFKDGFLELKNEDITYKSKGGRNLLSGGGITPDILTKKRKIPSYVSELWSQGAFLSFAAYYYPYHPELSQGINISNKIMSDFKNFLNDYDLDFKVKGEIDLNRLKDKIKNSSISINKYSRNISFSNSQELLIIKEFENYFNKLKLVQFSLDDNQKWIKNGLLREFSRVIYGEKERIKASLKEDLDYNEAKELLLNESKYYKILNI